MECPECQFENPNDSLFCGDCGASLEVSCSKCGSTPPPDFKFCNKCGYNLKISSTELPKEHSFDEKLAKIKKYLPKGLAQKILSQRDRIEGERKQVTVMFCDMEGFTRFTHRLGPEEAYAIMDQVYEILIHKVHDYEGTVNEMTGDGIMALFGAPIAQEDAPQRAIRSAYAIHREMLKFSDRIRKEKAGILPLKMRIGIHTGPVIVGTLGNDLRVDFKAVGDTVNLASRIEGLAEPGATYVSEDTFRHTEGLFRFEALGERRVKGKTKPVKVFRVIAPSTRRTRFDVCTERGLTPFVGRQHEFELLLDGFERIKTGRGQAFSIMAEAGIGKSRLLYEFRKAVTNEDVTFLEGKCLSYSRGIAYHPVIDVLKSNFEVREDDENSKIRAKVKRQLKLLNIDESSTLPYLLELLAVKDSGMDTIAMSPETRKARIVEAVKRITLKGSEIRPLVIAFEDLHWIDKSSEEYLKDLLNSISGARVFLIFTYRPEFVHTWGVRSYHSQLNLNRLSNRESLSLLTKLFGIKGIEKNLEELILKKTEGVPFFIEELIKSYKDLKIIENRDGKYHLTKGVQDDSIPSIIQDVIMARIDSLPERAKEILQTGSVVEREFSYELIKRVKGLSDGEFLSNMSILKDSELVYERGIFPQSAYIFRHALTQEVVYNSILNRRKKKLHQQIGLVIEETHQDDLEEVCEGLAEHFEKCEDFRRAAVYFKMSGVKATNSGAINESAEYARKTVDCLESLPTSEEVRIKIVDIRTILGLRLIDLNYFQQSKEMVSPVIKTASDLGLTRRLAQINTILGSYYFCVKEDLTKAFDHHYRSFDIARDLEDPNLLSTAHYWLGWPLAFSCDFESAADHFLQALDIHFQAGNQIWAPIISALTGHIAYYFWGKQGSAYEYTNKAVVLADESGDVYTGLIAYSCHGVSCLGKGDWDSALQYLSEGLTVAERVDQFYWLPGDHQFLGDTYYELGEYKKAINHYLEAIQNLERSGNLPSWKNLIELVLLRTRLAADEQPNFDPNSLVKYLTANQLYVYEGLIKRHIGEIMAYLGEFGEAGQWLEQAIETHQKNKMMYHLAGDYAVRSATSKRQNDSSAAREFLIRAINIFKKCGANGWVEKYENTLAQL